MSRQKWQWHRGDDARMALDVPSKRLSHVSIQSQSRDVSGIPVWTMVGSRHAKGPVLHIDQRCGGTLNFLPTLLTLRRLYNKKSYYGKARFSPRFNRSACIEDPLPAAAPARLRHHV